MQSNLRKLKAGLQYYMFKNGPLAMGTSPAALFARTRPELASADIKCSMLAVQRRAAAGRAAPVVGLYDDRLSAAAGKPRRDRAEEAPTRPTRRRSYPNYLATPTDQQTIVDGLKLLRRIMADAAHAALYRRRNSSPARRSQTDEQLLDYARRRGGTVYHPTSTCKMGVDAMAVVDPELRVHGLDGLARRRRLDHADGGLRQHQRGDDHDRREAPPTWCGSGSARGVAVGRSACTASSGSAAVGEPLRQQPATSLRYRCAKMPHVVASLQGAQPDDREDHAIRREFGLSRPHLLRPGKDPRRRRASVRRDRRKVPGRDRRVSAIRRADRTRSAMPWSFSSPTSSSTSCRI